MFNRLGGAGQPSILWRVDQTKQRSAEREGPPLRRKLHIGKRASPITRGFARGVGRLHATEVAGLLSATSAVSAAMPRYTYQRERISKATDGKIRN